ncbi:MAG: YkgJ family cysteine cluster protein [Candidatus Methanomethyliaceae archaeon]|nr:YkgJ family cysteine cluster protein [Candidatus Methanomethyliaceae archaeon]
MKYVPWSKISDWFCTACGKCCKEFKVPLRTYEMVLLANTFGFSCIEFGVSATYLKRRLDGRCVFQVKRNGKMVCGIQPLKPVACKMWPFAVFESPHYEHSNEASFNFKNETFYVYVNNYCRGLIYGSPSFRFINSVIPEFVELKLGLRMHQVRSTSLTIKIAAPKLKPPFTSDHELRRLWSS